MRKLLSVLVISILLLSCSDKEKEYPFDQSPYIEFEDLVFHDSQTADTLELSFIVWDREGNVGFRNEDITYPYHLYDIVLDGDGNLIKHDDSFNPPFSEVPAFYAFDPDTHQKTLFLQNELAKEITLNQYPDLSCEDYVDYDEYGNPVYLGTANKNYHNLDLTFYDSDNLEFDFREIFGAEEPYDLCGIGEFDARLFDYSHVNFFNSVEHMPFRIKRRDKYSVIITYVMQSAALRLVLLNNKFRVDISIKDRELNESNIASSGLVTLEEITVE